MGENVVVLNLPAIRTALHQFPSLAQRELETASNEILLGFIPELAHYPPALSSYRRTGTLGRLWTTAQPAFTASSSGWEATIGNATPYAPLVQGEKQSWMHKRRWKTVKDFEKRRAVIEAGYKRAADRIEAALKRMTL